VRLRTGFGASPILKTTRSHRPEAQMDTVMERNHILDARDRTIAQTKSRAWLHA